MTSESLQKALDTTKYLMPEPFDWCYIPTHKKFGAEHFYIAKYPVTNAQFAKFIESGAYQNESWWTPEGWEYRQKYQISTPRYWHHSLWNGDDYPVVGVSWYEALAFCSWLSSMTNQDISLPRGDQWLRAAIGDDNRPFPWGNHHRKTIKANMPNGRYPRTRYESSRGHTSPVNAYPAGESPFGVFDMLGNVWEWTLTDYWFGNQKIKEYFKPRSKILRGGSWFCQAVINSQSRNHPCTRNSFCGFRICLNIAQS